MSEVKVYNIRFSCFDFEVDFRLANNDLQYRVDVTFMADVPDIKNYICGNLTTKDMKIDSASVVDHSQNLVRLVCSDKAGMGKKCSCAK